MHSLKNLKLFIFFLACALCLVTFGASASAEDALGPAKALFLQRQYVQAIDTCGAVIKNNPGNPDVVSEANYLTATSYANLFDFLTAKKNFKAIVDNYKGSRYYEDAYVALGDIEFLQENYQEALKNYYDFLSILPSKKRLATVYYHLAETNLKLGHRDDYQKFLKKLKEEFPLSFEAKEARRLEGLEQIFTVQVGAFTSYENAQNFIDQLKAKGYDVYSVVCMLSGKKLCRVRIGKFKTPQEAEECKNKLEREGYFAKVFPLD